MNRDGIRLTRGYISARKPRISKKGAYWICSDSFHSYLGITPREAYRAWATRLRNAL